MLKQGLPTILLCVFLSVLASTATNLAFDRHRDLAPPGIIHAKAIELIDSQGRLRATFELTKTGESEEVPHLVMSDADGRDVIEMAVDHKGRGIIGFASEHWNEGAVTLGHLELTDIESLNKPIKDVDKSGAWGILVRSPQSKYTGIGFFNSGRPITPATTPSDHQ